MMTKSKNLKKRIAVLSILCMVISLMPAGSFGLETSDISGHWAKDNIQNWVERGLINGYEDGTFRPDSNISRAEFMTLVNKTYNFTEKAELGFLDVGESDWYFSEVAKAKAAGYISGYPDNTMRPEGSITRSEAAAIIMRINKLEGNLKESAKFTDALKLDWGASAIGAVFKHKIMNGYPDGSFMAQNLIKRGEAVVALDKASAYSKANTTYDVAGTYGPASGTLAVEGNVIITQSDTILQNMVIAGDLTIRKSVGEGDVNLNNVTVKGETLVCGGGPNSVWAYNSRFGTVTIIKEVGDIRFLITGTTTVDMVIAESSVKLEEQDMVGANVGFIEVHFEGQPHDTLILIGCFGDVDVNNPDTNVEMPSGTTVDSMCLNQRTDVTGEGVVALANIFVDGSTFEFSPETFDIVEGVAAPVSENPTAEVVVTPPSGGGGHADSTVAVSGITIGATGDATAVVSGGALTMSATISPSNATNQNVVWSVENGTGTATVDSSTGILTGTSPGTVIVIATAQDASGEIGEYNLTIATTKVLSGDSIQTAIDESTAGDIILIGAGTYIASNTTINKTLTLIGESKAGVIIVPAAEDGNVDSAFATNAQNGFIIKAHNVTIKNLSINGRGNTGLTVGKNNFRAGIVSLDASQTGGGAWNNLLVDNVYIGYTYRRGISVFPRSVYGTVIQNSTVEYVAYNHGMYIGGQSQILNNTVTHCFQGIIQDPDATTTNTDLIKVNGNTLTQIGNFVGAWGYPNGQPRAIQPNPTGPARTFEVKNNIINDSGSVGLIGTVGIYTRLFTSTSSIEHNTITMTSGTSWETGMQSVGMLLGWSYANGFTVTNNHITSSGYGMGIMVFGTGTAALPLILEGNTITGTNSTRSDTVDDTGDGTGIYIANQYLFASDKSESYVIIRNNNNISGFVRGIEVELISTSTQPLTIITTGNAITGNTIGFESNLVTEINATLNYWGNASPTWSAIISGNVNYDPWYTDLDKETIGSSQKVILSTTYGAISGGNVRDVPGETKVDLFKAGLTVSNYATIEILTGTGESPVEDQTTTDITSNMVIKVTAGDGSSEEYTIAILTT